MFYNNNQEYLTDHVGTSVLDGMSLVMESVLKMGKFASVGATPVFWLNYWTTHTIENVMASVSLEAHLAMEDVLMETLSVDKHVAHRVLSGSSVEMFVSTSPRPVMDSALVVLSSVVRNAVWTMLRCSEHAGHNVSIGDSSLYVMKSFLCFGRTRACDGHCMEGRSLCGDSDRCIVEGEEAFKECHGKCIPFFEPCDDTCPTGSTPCGEDCIGNNRVEDFWVCEDKCQFKDVPCGGQCPDDRVFLDCELRFGVNQLTTCQKPGGPYQNCDGKCIKSSKKCNGKCVTGLEDCGQLTADMSELNILLLGGLVAEI